MAAWMTLEEGFGTSRHQVHPHNGYYAGDLPSTGDKGLPAADHDGQRLVMTVVVLTTGTRLRLW